MSDPEILVVGAGVAGLSAMAALRAAGRKALCVEALDRPGGRAHTTRPARLGGAPFDHGAYWLHDATRNPVAALARAAGEKLLPWTMHRFIRVGDRFQTPEEDAALAAAWRRYDETARRLAVGAARSLSAVADALAHDPDVAPWLPTIEAWEGPIIDAAAATDIGLRDWADNALDDENLVPPNGLGDLVGRLLLPRAGDIACATPVVAIAHDGNGIAAETPRGTIRADAAIVTASTAALARIRFTPDLPPAHRQAISDLPLGQAIKVAWRATGPGRLGLPQDSSLSRRFIRRNDAAIVFTLWPFGQDHVVAWIGGPAATQVAGNARAAADLARTALIDMLGATAGKELSADAEVADWSGMPSIAGAYSDARPGADDPARGARATLAAPAGRLVFAGEACHQGMAGTVAGAWLSGQSAAEHLSTNAPWQTTRPD